MAKTSTSETSDGELQRLREEVARLRKEASRRNENDERRRARESLTRGILNSVVVGVVRFDADLHATYANAYGRPFLEFTGVDVSKASLRDYVPYTIWSDGSPCAFDDYPAVRCLRTGEPQGPVTIGLRRESGETTWGAVFAMPILDRVSGKPTSVVVTFVDVTQSKRAEELLRQSEDRYRRLVEEAPDAIVVHQDGKMVFVNNASVRLWRGKSREEFIGRQILDFVDPRNHEDVVRRVQQIHEGVTAPLQDQLHVRLDGTRVRVEVTGMPCIYDGRPGVQAILRDVTRRRHIERQVRRQRELLRKFFNHIPLFVGLFDVDGKVRVVNRQWRRVLGWGRGFTLSELLDRFYPDALDRARVVGYIETGRPGWRDMRVCTREGQTLDVSWANIVLSDGTRMAIGQDATHRKKAEADLRRHKDDLEQRVRERTDELVRRNEELRGEISVRRAAESQLQEKQQILEQLLDTHERYRQLVSYEIHDAFLQDVVGGLMFLDLFHDERSDRGDQDLKYIERAQLVLRKAIAAARRMISDLRPPIIDEQGVVSAIEYLVSELNAHGMDIRLQHDVRVRRMPPVLEAAVFRIAQEALANVQRHSGSQFAQVNISQVGDILKLEIRDFGVGFDAEQVTRGHFGLQGIRERARLFGGTVTVSSAPGKGTEICVEVPVTTLQPQTPNAPPENAS